MLCSNADFFADALGFLRGAPILLRRDRSPPTLPRGTRAHHRLRRRFAATIFATPIGLCIILSAAGLPASGLLNFDSIAFRPVRGMKS
jgi:hypothetical protein